jgi:hypothetical protein
MTLVLPDKCARLVVSPKGNDKNEDVILGAFVFLVLITVTFPVSALDSIGLHHNGWIIYISWEGFGGKWL